MVVEVFNSVGSTVVATTQFECDSYVVDSASTSMCFDILDSLSDFLQNHGASEQDAQVYLSSLFQGLATTVRQRSDESFAELKVGYCTLDDLIEQFSKVYIDSADIEALEKAMQIIPDRILK